MLRSRVTDRSPKASSIWDVSEKRDVALIIRSSPGALRTLGGLAALVPLTADIAYKYLLPHPIVLVVPAVLWSVILYWLTLNGFRFTIAQVAAIIICEALIAIHYIIRPVSTILLLITAGQAAALWAGYTVGVAIGRETISGREGITAAALAVAVAAWVYTAVAAAQIWLGPQHWLNAAGSVERTVIADWIHPANPVLELPLVRVASLTTHPGKLGQIMFLLFWFLVVAAIRILRGQVRMWIVLSVLVAFIGVLVTGQRAGIIGVGLVIAMLVSARRVGFALAGTFTIGLVGLAATLSAFVESVAARSWTVMVEAPDRVVKSVVGLWEVLKAEPIGIGQGLRSGWSERFGGMPIYMDPRSLGAESGWVKVALETGLLGVIVYVMVGGMIVRALWRTVGSVGAVGFGWYWFAWAFVHDTFGNIVAMQMVFVLAGLILGERSETRSSVWGAVARECSRGVGRGRLRPCGSTTAASR